MIWSSGVIHITSFSLQFLKWPNKLECYITQGWKSLPVTHTLLYRAHSVVYTPPGFFPQKIAHKLENVLEI